MLDDRGEFMVLGLPTSLDFFSFFYSLIVYLFYASVGCFDAYHSVSPPSKKELGY